MKGIFKVLGIIALIGFIGFSFSTCKEPEDNSLPALAGTISITGIAQVGETLSVDTSSLGGSGVISFQWIRSGGTVIGSGSSYTVQDDDVGLTIAVTVTRFGNSGSITSPPTVVVTPANFNPTESDFNIGNLTQTYGNITEVTITPKAGKSAGTITIFYNELPSLPTLVGTYSVTFNVAASTGWNAANGLDGGLLTINKTTGIFGTPEEINTTYTHSLTLADLSLPIGYTWNAPSTILNAGNGQQFPATYNNPSGNYESANGNIIVNIAKAIGDFGNPTEIHITYTSSLTLANLSLPSGYIWDLPFTILNVGNAQLFSAIFTHPSDNYEPVSGYITVNVSEAIGNFGNPAAINITYTSKLTLADLILPTGYVWNYPGTSLNAGNDQLFPATYTDLSGNYEPAIGNVMVIVAKANGVFDSPAALNITYTPTLTLANLLLETGYSWNNSATILNAGNEQSFPATYIDPSGNYTEASGFITVNVLKATGAVVGIATLISRTHNSIIINSVSVPSSEQTVEYAISITSTTPTTGWQANLIFTNLSPGTTYYIFSRSAANDNYDAGAAVITEITTLIPESLIVTFATIIDAAPLILDQTISLTGSNKTVTLTVDNSNNNYSSIMWYVTGTSVSGSGISFTLDSSNPAYNRIGEYFLTIEVWKDGKPYNKTIIFNVTP